MPAIHPLPSVAPRAGAAAPIRRRALALAMLAVATLAGCGGGAIRERLRPATPREQYARALADAGLDRTALGRDWLVAGERALAAPALAALPIRETGFFAPSEAGAVAWRVEPRRGQRLVVRVEAQADSGTRVFAELFAQEGDTTRAPELVASSEGARAELAATAERATRYVLRLQPELLRAVRWTVTLEAAPSLTTFPVQGKDARAVQSFWGADRDAGARRHEGVDIFARRGTPVLAASDGVVRRVGENGLGGRIVFLSDLARGHALYYAHLDSQAVRTGQRVRAGDTLGFVGNTGNARTTAPHLHFGIYRAGEGPVDPLPYLDAGDRAPATVPARLAALAGRPARTTAAGATLRAGPGARARALATVPRHTIVAVDGASIAAGADGGWVRVRLPDRTSGYLPAAAVESAARAIGRERLAASAAVRAHPTADAPAVRTVSRATDAPVFGRFGDYALVEVDDGARGWVDTSD